MLMLPRIDPGDAAPIWRQIEDGVGRLATSGRLRPGEALPSIRELARQLRVNPATVSKAYQRLADAGVLVVRRGEGTFVAERSPEETASARIGLLRQGAHSYAGVARLAGASRQEAHLALDQAWSPLADGTGADALPGHGAPPGQSPLDPDEPQDSPGTTTDGGE